MCRPGGIDGVQLVDVRGLRRAFPPHVHDEWAIGYLVSGVQTFAFGRRRWGVVAGDAILTAPSVVHTGHPIGPTDYRAVHIAPDVFDRLAPGDGGAPDGPREFAWPVVRDARLCAAIDTLHEAAAAEAPDHELWEATRRVVALAGADLRRVDASARPDEPEIVSRARAYLREHVADPVPLQRLAALTGVSAYHLNRVFARHVGAPPLRYQLALRAGLVKTLLDRGHSLARAAAEAGYADQSHMTRHFKRYVGITPASYARAFAPAGPPPPR